MIIKIFSIVWLVLLVIFTLYLHNGNGIFEKLEILGIKDDLITNDFYIMFGILALCITVYTTYLTYRDKLKIVIESRENKLINISSLLYSMLVFILIGFMFVMIQRNLLLSDMASEKEQQNYIKSLEERIINLENKYR